jgi:membrane-associated protease RseP (regulator of RpoE activity)
MPESAPAAKPPDAMSAPRYTTWHVVGIVAGLLAIVAVACLAGAAVGFGYGRAASRAALSAAGMRSFMLPNGSVMPFGYGDDAPFGFGDETPFGMMEPRLAGAPYLGVTYGAVGADQAEQEGLAANEGALVSAVMDGSPAAQAGLQAGDILLAVDGGRIVRTAMLRRLIQAHAVGDEVSLLVLRNGNEHKIVVTLGQAPDAVTP